MASFYAFNCASKFLISDLSPRLHITLSLSSLHYILPTLSTYFILENVKDLIIYYGYSPLLYFPLQLSLPSSLLTYLPTNLPTFPPPSLPSVPPQPYLVLNWVHYNFQRSFPILINFVS